MRVLRSTGVLAAPAARVFSLLEDPRMANELLPPWLRITVERAPWLPKPGARTLVQVALRGVRVELETELVEYRRNTFFLERQVRGPFARYEHAVHVADEAPGAGIRLTEILAYEPRLGLLGRLFDVLALRRDLERTLATRLARLKEILEIGPR